MATQGLTRSDAELGGRYRAVRALTASIAAPLSDADATIQPTPDASPAKWHLAHTAWFFETFVLRDHVPDYCIYDPAWAYLFNSYYEGEGDRIGRDRRGMLSRPALHEILDYRDSVDEALLAALPSLSPAALDLIELGLNHEQQHQELLLMDMLAAMAANPLKPAIWNPVPRLASDPVEDQPGWTDFAGGVVEIGHSGGAFAFDNEGPRHSHFLAPYRLADRVVTNGEWCAFIEEGGYRDSRLWLSDGWAWVKEHGVEAPLYWERGAAGWERFGLDGLCAVHPAVPVCHISFYEADAFARWVGARLPTEQEWEHAASGMSSAQGHFLDDAGPVRPAAEVSGLFGNVWQWTASAYLSYPGYAPDTGTVGEYNGKFMSGQMVLRGGSCATPRGHVRASYRNFFYPHQRWMFSGLRLACDA